MFSRESLLLEFIPTNEFGGFLLAKIGKMSDVKFEDIPGYADLIELQEWKGICDSGGFIDDDGFGELATDKKVSNIAISPSQRNRMDIPDWVTHVAWYNR